MLLALLFTISHIIIVTTANPFHKYPFVFLLDVGNEELKQTNSEQIRVSIPGGTLAIRYPATGYGDTITHVRVSGIDFGTDLKANILDGGPGYKYVVLVFMGNQGVPYDAVVTVKTIPEDKIDDYDQDDRDSESNNTNQVDDANDSAEDASDDSDVPINGNTNEKLVQASSNSYSYPQNEVLEPAKYRNDGKEYPDDEDVQQSSNEKDIHEVYGENANLSDDKEDVEVKDYIVGGDDYQDDQNQYSEDSKPDQYSVNEDITNYDDSNKGEEIQIGNLFHRYKFLRPSNNEVKPQELSEQDGNVQSGYDEEDPGDSDQMFNDEEIHNDAEKDTNNNVSFDNDDRSAVAY